jgi:hypothetical protein
MTAKQADNGTPPAPRGRGLRALLVLIVVLAGGIAAWSWVTLSWSYADGERAGVLQKFSHKGWVCKTDEGELAMYIVAGVAPQIWNFTVRDPGVVKQMNSNVGRHVQLHYTEHRGLPSSCFGDTRYFVDKVVPVDAGATAN